MCGDILERLERRVRLESLREVLGALITDVVARENERLEGRVRLESLREVFCALRTDVVVVQTASEGGLRVSAAIDSGEKGVRWRTRAR